MVVGYGPRICAPSPAAGICAPAAQVKVELNFAAAEAERAGRKLIRTAADAREEARRMSAAAQATCAPPRGGAHA